MKLGGTKYFLLISDTSYNCWEMGVLMTFSSTMIIAIQEQLSHKYMHRGDSPFLTFQPFDIKPLMDELTSLQYGSCYAVFVWLDVIFLMERPSALRPPRNMIATLTKTKVATPMNILQTTITCVAGVEGLAIALRTQTEASGYLYGTSIFDTDSTDIDLSHYTYANEQCDCADATAIVDGGDCEGGYVSLLELVCVWTQICLKCCQWGGGACF